MIRPILAAVLMLAASRDDGFAQASFTGLGFLPGGSSSYAYAISADGKVVVGASDSSSGHQAFRWTTARGMVGLGKLPGSRASFAYGVSGDGSVVVGWSAWQAFRWMEADGMVGLGYLPGGSNSSANAVSSNGKVVVGKCESASDTRAFRWTAADGMVCLGSLPVSERIMHIARSLGGSLPREDTNSVASAVSSDGSVIVGWTGPAITRNRSKIPLCYWDQAFHWTVTDGMASISEGNRNNLSNLGRFDNAYAVSRDGSVIVGGASAAYRSEAFCWTAGGGILGIGVLPRMDASVAKAVSDDGNVIVGRSGRGSEWDAFIWVRGKHMRSINSALAGEDDADLTGWRLLWNRLVGQSRNKPRGVDLTGWKLTEANGISADGKTIVGTGEHNGDTEAWIAHLDSPLNAPAAKGKSQQIPRSR